MLIQIKTIVLHQDHIDVKYITNEIDILSKLQNERVVQYMKTWIDNKNSLYIQMEFCCDNLKNILCVKNRVLRANDKDIMNDIDFIV